MSDTYFSPRGDKAEMEEGPGFSPKFDADGLITVVTTDAETGDILMVAYMNEEALTKTIETGEAWYWSRSRGELWHKGDTSGQLQTVVEMLTDCDQDTIQLRVKVGGDGGCCHVGYRSCFYRRVPLKDEAGKPLALQPTGAQKL
ncbi:phosphoribosyl-AMP cyclohydrolase [Parvibaculum indicum]|uniref:phosphoribosyl-AMP cyclohydrolase n=1 Tax=Parvibaculum indicum TaxID=562969 RepID=UPI0014203052|nr:phosphoribosyl-AMP cyclohydrolase [Parvibaculum indicum]NIJ40189.1 phosphoribosyl-AMP cyclohydrolase [Parvibaculum indicum]